MTKQNELLDQLKIDRSAPEPAGVSVLTVAIIAAVAVVIGVAGGALLLGDDAPTASEAPTEATPARATTPRSTAPSSGEAPTPATAAAVPADARILNASGYITARRIATVSSQITGLITEVNVEEGMVVERGQVLARLDDEIVSVDLRLARARLDSQRAFIDNVTANLAEAERVYARATRLRPENLVSEAQLSEATARFDALQADLKRAESDINVLELEVRRQQERLDDHIIRAPYAGVVTVKNAQTGEIVSPGSAGGGFTRTGICTIVDMDSLEIEVDVNESFIGRVFTDQRVVANLDAYPDWDIPAAVIAIIPTADRAKATVRVRIGIEVRDPRILPDMGVKVAFLQDQTARSLNMSDDILFDLKGVEKKFVKGKDTITVFDSLDMSIARGDFLAIMGPSGSGKTTLLNMLGGVDQPSAGEIWFDGSRIDSLSESQLAAWRANNIGFIFQFYNLMPMLNAERNVELPLLLTRLSRSERKKNIAAALELVSLSDRARHMPKEMSGGQQQRVAIARALVSDPKLLLCDEPTGDLDRQTADEILAMLQLLNREYGKTIVMVTHDPAAAKYAKRTLHLDKGEFVEKDLAA